MTLADLAGQVQALQDAVEELKRPRVRLRVTQAGAYLGQPVSLAADVTGPDDAPLAQVSVTWMTTWGALTSDDGAQTGAGLEELTGTDGTARAVLRPALSEDPEHRQDALETMLRLLDPNAPTPSAALAGFQELARQYRWEANAQFREALDIYFRDFGRRALDTVAHRDFMLAWSYVRTTVLVAVTDSGTGAILGSAALAVELRDWLGPWLQAYSDTLRDANPLGQDFDKLKKQTATPGALLDGIFNRTRVLVDAEFGVIGKSIAQKTAESSIDAFRDSGTTDLPAGTRLAIAPGLEVGARALGQAGVGMVAALGQTRVMTAGAATAVAGKVDLADFKGFQTQVSTSLATKLNSITFNTFQGQVTTALGTKADVSALAAKADKTAVDGLQTALASKADAAALAAKADKTAVDGLQAALANKADVSALAAKADQATVDGLQAALGAKADAGAFAAFQRDTQQALASKLDTTVFTTFSTDINTVLGRKIDRTEFTNALASKVDANTFTTFQTQTTATLQTKADTTALARLEGRIGRIQP